MPTITVSVSDQEKEAISELAKAATLYSVAERIDKTTLEIREGRNARIIADRTKAIEQIKRLFAVVMGFAAIAIVNNTVFCFRALNSALGMEAYLILASLIISFFSLLILLLFGAERLFDTKYLQPTSAVPSWYGLTVDVVSLLMTAGWFIVMANLLPVPSVSKPVIELSDLRLSQKYFIFSLIALYAFDFLLILYQCLQIKSDNIALRAHLWWMAMNLVAGISLFFGVLWMSFDPWNHVPSSPITLGLIGVHVIRFGLDLWLTFDFYYPHDKLSTAA